MLCIFKLFINKLFLKTNQFINQGKLNIISKDFTLSLEVIHFALTKSNIWSENIIKLQKLNNKIQITLVFYHVANIAFEYFKSNLQIDVLLHIS